MAAQVEAVGVGIPEAAVAADIPEGEVAADIPDPDPILVLDRVRIPALAHILVLDRVRILALAHIPVLGHILAQVTRFQSMAAATPGRTGDIHTSLARFTNGIGTACNQSPVRRRTPRANSSPSPKTDTSVICTKLISRKSRTRHWTAAMTRRAETPPARS